MKNDFISTATKTDNSTRKRKIMNILKKIFIYTMVAVGVLFLLAIAYQVFEILFTLAILIIAWLCPKRWR